MIKQDDKKIIYYLLAATAAMLVFLYFARRVVTPFFIAFALAYLLDPLVDKIQKWKLSRTLAVVLLMSFFFLLLFIGGAITVPLFRLQVENLAASLPEYIQTLQNWIRPLLDNLIGMNPEKAQEIIALGMQKIGELPLKILSVSTSFLWDSLSSLVNIILMAVNIFIIPVAMFYLLRDYDLIIEKIRGLVPLRFQNVTREVFTEIDDVLSNFVRGQLMVATLMAGMYCIGLYICGTPMSLLLGIVAGYANLVPYLGLVFGFIPAALLTFLQFHDPVPLVGVVAVFAVVQMLEGMLITPKVVGDKIGLHPVAIMLAILIGAEFFGFMGIFLAVPVAAVLNVLLARGLKAYKKSAAFT